MDNRPGASFLQNIIASSAAFTDPLEPNDPNFLPDNFNMPGEFLARTFFLTAGLNALPQLSMPSMFNAQVANVDLRTSC